MSHRNARLTVHGRRLLVHRVAVKARPSLMSPRRWACHVSARIVGSPVSTLSGDDGLADRLLAAASLCRPAPATEIEGKVLGPAGSASEGSGLARP